MSMRCLWLTSLDPEPEHSGQLIYSGRMIDALAATGTDVEVLCVARQTSTRRNGDFEGGVRWWLATDMLQPRWKSMFSGLPNLAYRSCTPGMRQGLQMLLEQRRWDCVVVDGLFVGWALAPLLRHYAEAKERPRLVYVSHNHEASTRLQVAQNYRGNPVRKALLLHDAEKAKRLEDRLVDAADLITAITPDDATLYAAQRPNKPTLVLSPGYRGRRVPVRRITADLPRRAVVIGSFDWVAKRMNLQEFLVVADPMFAAAGAELQVIGSGEESFLGRLRRELSTTTLTGAVDSVFPYMDAARIAIVPERTGGGFKLKVLDYVFNRLPIAALENSVAGMPLEPNESILTYRHHGELARGVLNAIDDLDLLNHLQEHAYSACADRFDWQSRGEQLYAAIAAS